MATNYCGTITVSADNGSGGLITLTTYTFDSGDAGVVEIDDLTLTSVYGTNDYRTITVADSTCNVSASINVAVWFYVISTDEGLVGHTTACGHVITTSDHFVALPSTGLCNQSVAIQSPGGTNQFTDVLDVGPWFPFHISGCTNYPNDPYWNGTGVPRAAGMIGQVRACDPSGLHINGAGIDLADGTFAALGSPSNVYWRWDNGT